MVVVAKDLDVLPLVLINEEASKHFFLLFLIILSCG
jgi:hypothetical protein